MNRYEMIVTNGSYREIESDTGEWVRYDDVKYLIENSRDDNHVEIEMPKIMAM